MPLRSYFVRVKITRQYSSNIVKTLDFAVQNVSQEPDINNSIKMEVLFSISAFCFLNCLSSPFRWVCPHALPLSCLLLWSGT